MAGHSGRRWTRVPGTVHGAPRRNAVVLLGYLLVLVFAGRYLLGAF